MEQVRIASLDVTLKSAIRNLKSAILAGAVLFALCVVLPGHSRLETSPNRLPGPKQRSSSAGHFEAFRQEMNETRLDRGKEYNHRLQVCGGKNLSGYLTLLLSWSVSRWMSSCVHRRRLCWRQKTQPIRFPIVMAVSGDAVASGLVASLARPGGNITGLTSFTGELAGKRLEILKETVPKLSRVAVPGLAAVRALSQRLQLKEIRAAALALNLKSEEIELDPKDLEGAFQTAMRKQVNTIIVASAAVIFAERKRIVELAIKYRLPAAYSDDAFVDDGGLIVIRERSSGPVPTCRCLC